MTALHGIPAMTTLMHTPMTTSMTTLATAGPIAGLQVPVPPGGPVVALALTVVSGGMAGLGLWLLLAATAGWDVVPERLRHSSRRTPAGGSTEPSGGILPAVWGRSWPASRRLRVAALAGLAVGVLAAGVLRLPVLALLAAGVVLVALEAARGPSVPDLNARGAAVAAWCETVRQELDAGQPQRAALVAACDMPPAGLEQPLARLAERLEMVPVPEALWAFAREVDHPAVGNVVAALDVAYRLGAADLPRLMAGQVETTRHQVQMLREVHAARAKHRRSMVLLLGLFTVSIAGLFVVWPDFLVAYRDLTGQLILGGIGAGVLLAVRAFLRLSQPKQSLTFFTHASGADNVDVVIAPPGGLAPTDSVADGHWPPRLASDGDRGPW